MLEKILRKTYFWYQRFVLLFTLLFLRKKTIYLFGCPIHANIGDQAQTYCIEKWLKKNHPEHNVVKLNWSTSFPLARKMIRKRINQEDLIYFHSGYFMVDHHGELPTYMNVVAEFKDHRIVILPQTINLKNKSLIAKISGIFNAHPNLYLLCRDEVSYGKAQELFADCNLLLYPDVVTSMIGGKKYTKNRHGILFCVRDDAEAFYSVEAIDELTSRFDKEYQTTKSDTSIKVNRHKLETAKGEVIHEMLDYFSQFKLIITDRYHGTIFSLITGTPVIVLSSADHKLSSGVKWFPEEFKNYIVYAENLDKAHELALEMLGGNHSYELPPYFQENYYDLLKSKLEG